ncbi:MAG TPA: hypothetical protein VHO93_07345 [Actinomycetota bacterium]|nr:hypothetical protein [Actinomycetota bacterium]
MRPRASSSQPTGWAGRRLAAAAPTVAALTAASTGAATAAPSGARSGRPAWRSRWSSHQIATRPSMANAHSAQASPVTRFARMIAAT